MPSKKSDILYSESNPKYDSIYDKVLKHINKKYDLRFNEINHDVEISLRNKHKWTNINQNSLLIELVRNNINISMPKVEFLLKSNLIRQYNPITEYFDSLQKWDGIDYIKQLCSYVPTFDDTAFEYHLKKWMVRVLKCVFLPGYFNKQCFVLVHSGQNSGKSTWCRFLCPPALKEFMAEDISTDKDSRIQLCRNILINLDELAVKSKSDINALKSLFTKAYINERLPYGRKNTFQSRICSFLGSTNEATFLTDETGSVRWLCFELTDKINFDYSKEVDINKVWSQVYHLTFNDSKFNPELSPQDLKANEERNKKYTNLTLEQELITRYYEKSNDLKDFVTSSDVEVKLMDLKVRVTKVNIGKAFSGFNYNRLKHPKLQIYGYLAKSKFKISPLELNYIKNT